MEEAFEDPITFEVMEEACITPCGHSFSKHSIEEWLESKRDCPTCKSPLSLDQLKPNYALRSAISQYLESKAQHRPPEPQISAKAIPVGHGRIIKEVAIKDLDRASTMLGDIFVKDPWIEYIFGKDETPSRQGAVAWFLSILLEYGIKHGRVWGAYNPKTMLLEGVSVWQPPYEAGVSMWRMLKSGFAAAPFKIGVSATWRLLSILDQSEKLHLEAMEGISHWTLYSMGVTTEFQRMGIGTSMIQPVLNSADRDGIQCYLDTAAEASVKFFEKNGWRVVRHVSHPGRALSSCDVVDIGMVAKGPPFWTMQRYAVV